MRILWFTNTPSCYQKEVGGYNGGGWISSLELELKKKEGVELAIGFYANKENEVKKEVQNDTVYYLLPRPKKSLAYTFITLRAKFEKSSLLQEKVALPELVKVVRDFNPDIIQVFGSENIYALIAKYVNMPVVLHIQGLLSPSLNAFLPPFVSWRDYLFQFKSIRRVLNLVSEKVSWQRNSVTEKRMLKGIKYFMGRTEWDKRIIHLLNPQAKYYYCSEILRDTFYLSNCKRILPSTPMFVTTISSQLYKGYDLILKTAKILKESGMVDFRWKVFGDVNPRIAERVSGVKHEEVNVDLLGVASAEKIKEALLQSTAYIHTSYIDNSPNSLCEATMLGVTVISTNVGGISSLIEDGKTGFLVPANDPYQMAYLIKYLYEHNDINRYIGIAAQEVAMKRHDREIVVNRVLEIYNKILENEQSC